MGLSLQVWVARELVAGINFQSARGREGRTDPVGFCWGCIALGGKGAGEKTRNSILPGYRVGGIH